MHEVERAATIVTALGKGLRPRVGMILGSGLGGVADAIEGAMSIAYGELPGFTVGKVSGHAGRLILGRLAGMPVACLSGRAHIYEGATPQALRVPVRTLKKIGCDTLIVTNAAGGCRRDMAPGSLMLISDHINMTGVSPLIGPNDDAVGPRFFSLEDAYDPALRVRLTDLAGRLGVPVREGVYLAYLGPNYETPAEIRAFASWGADAVGMSTVHEVIVARHCGLRVAAISVITNLAAGLSKTHVAHDRVLDVAAEGGAHLERLLTAFLAELAATP